VNKAHDRRTFPEKP